MGALVSVARRDDVEAAVREALGHVALDEIVRGRAVAIEPFSRRAYGISISR